MANPTRVEAAIERLIRWLMIVFRKSPLSGQIPMLIVGTPFFACSLFVTYHLQFMKPEFVGEGNFSVILFAQILIVTFGPVIWLELRARKRNSTLLRSNGN